MTWRRPIPGAENKAVIFLLLAVVISAAAGGVLFFKRQALSPPMMGMNRDEYQAYQLEHQQLLFENERLGRQLRALEQAAARQGIWLDKVQEENLQLRDKILLMDRLARLQKSISELKEKQAREDVEREGAVKADLPSEPLSWETLAEARDALEKAKLRIQSVQEQMNALTSEDEGAQLAVQEEMDRVQSLMGNKGYLFRESRPVPGGDSL